MVCTGEQFRVHWLVIRPHLHAYTFYGFHSTNRTKYQIEADDAPADYRRRIDSLLPTPSGMLSVAMLTLLELGVGRTEEGDA